MFNYFLSESLRKWPAALMTDRQCSIDCNIGKPNDGAESDYIVNTLIIKPVLKNRA